MQPDLSFFEQIDPDDAKTRCATVQGHFPVGTTWDIPVNTAYYARREWPTEIFFRRAEIDDLLLHPAVLGVKIFCEMKARRSEPSQTYLDRRKEVIPRVTWHSLLFGVGPVSSRARSGSAR